MMESDKSLENTYCAFSSDELHLVSNPILLECGHPFCQSCVNSTTLKKVKCNTCDKSWRLVDIRKLVDEMNQVQIKLNENFDSLKEKFKTRVNDLKNSIDFKQEKLQVDTKYAKEEIEIRVESMKIELDVFKESLYDKLDAYTKEFNRKKKIVENLEYDEYSMKLNDIKRVNQDEFNIHEAALKRLQDDLDLFKAYYTLKFEPSEQSIPIELIADVDFSTSSIHHHSDQIKDCLLKDAILTPGDYFHNGCVLPNGNTAFYNQGENIEIRNSSNHELKRTIKKINDKKIDVFCIQCDDSNVYINTKNSIIVTDVDFNFKKEHKLPKSFDDGNQASYYFNLRLYKGQFYILVDFKSEESEELGVVKLCANE